MKNLNIKLHFEKAKRFVLRNKLLVLSIILIPFVLAVSFKRIMDKTVKHRTMRIEYLVVHYTANPHPKASAEMNARYLRNKSNAGTHYCIDDEEVIQCTDESNVAYAVGDRKWLGFIPKFWLKDKIKNNNSLSFEMCLGGGRNDSLIMDRTAQFIGWQLVNKGLDISHVVRHHDVSGKQCPKFNYNEVWDEEKEDRAWKHFLGEVRFYWNAQLQRKYRMKSLGISKDSI